MSSLVQQVLARAAAEKEAPDAARGSLERQLTDVEAALQRLSEAVAVGGDVPALVDAIKIQDSQRRLLERKLEDLRRPAVVFDQALEQRLRAAVGEWRDVLGRQIPQARQIVTKLLEGRLTFTPELSDGRPGFRFQATGTVEKLISGVVPECLRAVASPSNPILNSWVDWAVKLGKLRLMLQPS